MACFRPLRAFQLGDGTVTFAARHGQNVRRELTLPCGQCIGCRLERSRQWATRCLHEAQMHDFSSFVTLTYNEDSLPARGSLVYKDFQLFMKRLRKDVSPNPLRFYMCGEYGERFGRPHFHACLFGIHFSDRKLFKRLSSGFNIYTSDYLSRFWTLGFASVGDVTFESAAYVARYVTKKVTGWNSEAHYRRTDLDTGETYQIEPEFTRMSLKPGIGATWLEKYHKDVYPRDAVIVRGAKCKPPRYYDQRLETLDVEEFEALELTRYNKAVDTAENNTEDRLAVREECTRARLQFKKRSLE